LARWRRRPRPGERPGEQVRKRPPPGEQGRKRPPPPLA
jgi:hypothetical protein